MMTVFVEVDLREDCSWDVRPRMSFFYILSGIATRLRTLLGFIGTCHVVRRRDKENLIS